MADWDAGTENRWEQVQQRRYDSVDDMLDSLERARRTLLSTLRSLPVAVTEEEHSERDELEVEVAVLDELISVFEGAVNVPA
jgi:hypothetical protein